LGSGVLYAVHAKTARRNNTITVGEVFSMLSVLSRVWLVVRKSPVSKGVNTEVTATTGEHITRAVENCGLCELAIALE
jgi:hypothetical protein